MNRCRITIFATVIFASSLSAHTVVVTTDDDSTAGEAVDFNRDIRPILLNNCFKCHGPDESARQVDLRLDTHQGAISLRPKSGAAIVPGDPNNSAMIDRVSSLDESFRMPPADVGKHLTDHEIELIRKWIAEGAEYQAHWSYVKPVKPQLPTVGDPAWPENPIDNFVLAQLESNGLEPSPEAQKETLVRRLSLDLTGLPPTHDEVISFLNDESPEAYSKLVDRLLESPHFGERWARVWLDLARYADTKGYEKDERRVIWPYRDWVIKALNNDMPFDQFTIEQIAGDLLPGATTDQLIATAFHRNTMTNDEGGTDDEEFRVAAIVDRVNTTMQTWMGVTIGCAQCHSHKYDPISHKEYYKFFAFFNQTEDADKNDDRPRIPVPTAEQQQRLKVMEAELTRLRSEYEQMKPERTQAQKLWEEQIGRTTASWQSVRPFLMESIAEQQFTVNDDDSVQVTGPVPGVDTYTLSFNADVDRLTALRLEVIPDESHPGPGPGRNTHGNFVLSEWIAEVKPGDASNNLLSGRFVRIELPGDAKILSLAEVQVLDGIMNIAAEGEATQSSTDFEGKASLAIDGNTSGHYSSARSTTHTKTESNPWWELDLGIERQINHLRVWNRTDGALQQRLKGFRIIILDEDRNVVWSVEDMAAPNNDTILDTGSARLIRFDRAFASHNQTDWNVNESVNGDSRNDNGWAIAPEYARINYAVFVTREDETLPADSVLRISMVQNYGYEHVIGCFRLSVTEADRSTLNLSPQIAEILHVPQENRSLEQLAQIATHFRSISPDLKPIRDKIAAIESEKSDTTKNTPTVPVMRELAAKNQRITNIHDRGNFLLKGEQVTPGVPASLHAFPIDQPENRMGLAYWLIDNENPLTARVVVNRYWEKIFGRGIVETSENFGMQGSIPSHPELLDWLAVELVNRSWSLKELCRIIVTSATYRQSSNTRPELDEVDPENRLLGRAPRFRLEAEMVRDQALRVSGLFSSKMFGPSVFPPQPDGVWAMVYSNDKWLTSMGEDRYRRAMYTFWRRTSPYPSLITFDATSREFCVPRRIRTNTPLQALVTLNDPVYIEAAQALARRMVLASTENLSTSAQIGFRTCLIREPTTAELDLLLDLYDSELEYFELNLEDAQALAGTDEDGASKHAAWVVVANVLMNMDEFLTRN